MADLFVNAIFTVLNFISRLFLTPVLAIVNLFPSLAIYFAYIIQFFEMVFEYIGFALKLFMIPQGLVITLLGLMSGIFAFNITIRVVGLGMAVYRYFKP